MRPFINLSLALVTLNLWALPAQADLVFETEPNDTFASANETIGVDDLGFAGSLTVGDIDTFSLFVTPNVEGQASFAFDIDWSEGTSVASQTPPGNRWLVARLPVDNFFAQVGVDYQDATFFFGVSPSPAQVYYLQLYSTMSEPDPLTFDPEAGSTVVGDYRLTNIRGIDGTTVRGTASILTIVPEPSSILWGLALTGSGLWLRRRGKTLHVQLVAKSKH